jgi:glycolate oxidase FAD binding subunit
MSAITNIGTRLEGLLGTSRTITSEEDLREYAVDGVVPGAIVRPTNAEEVVELVRFALSDGLGLIPSGSRSKIEMGMPPLRYDAAVDMRVLQDIAHYDPGDLTLSVDAGMPLRMLEKALEQQRQFLPISVPCYETSTIGGALASGIDSTLRQQYGTVRDFLIGAEFVDGKGNLCKSGGRVVKNVTGYDLHKLLVGSLGTLGIITRLNFRTFPMPQVFGGYAASFSDAEHALRFRTTVEAKGLPLSNLELLNPEATKLTQQLMEKAKKPLPLDDPRGAWHAYLSYEGHETVVQRVSRELQKLACEADALQGGELPVITDAQLGGVLREAFDWLRWSAPLVALFRITLPQVTVADFAKLQNISNAAGLRSALFHRAAGVIYFAVLTEQEQLSAIDALSNLAEELFSAIAAKAGSAVLLHAPQTLKQRIHVWGPRRADFPLMERVKRAFDPKGVFAPGRFVGGL